MAWDDCRKPANSSQRSASRRWSSALHRDEDDDRDQRPGGEAERDVGPAQVRDTRHGLARGAEEITRHALEPRAREALPDALPQALERLHDAGPIEAAVHRPYGSNSGGMGCPGSSSNQIADATHHRFPSQKSCSAVTPRPSTGPSAVRRSSDVLNTCTLFPDARVTRWTSRSKNPSCTIPESDPSTNAW